MLWFDCTQGVHDAELRIQCANVFEVAHTSRLERAAEEIARLSPAVLSFDFDHPDQSSLQLMQSIKRTHPKLPILMLTLDHSESLAIWAFRARVWNFLVKPVVPEEFAENLDALARIGNRASPPRVAQLLPAAIPNDLPAQPIDVRIAQLQPAVDYIKQHYHEKVSASAAAQSCGLTRFEFSRRFSATFGTTFRDYLMRVRIMEARRMLTEGSSSVTDVAYSVGFNDGSHFAHLFRRHTGLLPSDYLLGKSSGIPRIPGPGGTFGAGQVPRRRATDLRPDDVPGASP